MRGIKEDAIAKISWGILGTMGLGLVALTTYITKISSAAELHSTQIREIQLGMAEVSTVKLDIAVIKEEVRQMRQMMEQDRAR